MNKNKINMSKVIKRIIIIVILIVALACILTWKWVFREQEKSVGSRKADIVVPATEMVKEFETDENKANIKYLNKVVAVSGIINSQTVNDKDITVILKNDGATAGVSCSFDKTTVDKSSISPGRNITAKGLCSGFLMDVVLNRCSIVNTVPK